MKIFGIAVCTNNGFIARNSYECPSLWASKEDQKFYLNKIKTKNPFCLMGTHTYNCKLQDNHTKNEVYATKDYIVLNDNIDYNNTDYIINSDNDRHVFIKIDDDKIMKKVNIACEYFSTKHDYLSILGGTNVYTMFLPFYDEFYLTVEHDIEFDSGIKLFDKDVSNINKIKMIFQDNNMYLSNEDNLSEKTTVYTFLKK